MKDDTRDTIVGIIVLVGLGIMLGVGLGMAI